MDKNCDSAVATISRRGFVAGATALLTGRWIWAESPAGPALEWMLNDAGDTAREHVTGSRDAISSRTGHALWVGSGENRALRLDGYSCWVEHAGAQPRTLGDAITFAAWVALEAYPVSEAAIIQCAASRGASGLLLDKWGYLIFRSGADELSQVCRSAHPMPRENWVHLAAAVTATGDVTLYQDGLPCGHLEGHAPPGPFATPVILGKWEASPVIARVFPTGAVNGLLRRAQIYPSALAPESIKQLVERTRLESLADLLRNGIWCVFDPQRPRFHAQPPRAWTNEPHGCIHWGDRYHLFYQKNANGPYWGNINWGHMTSPDLYHWTEMPPALSPEPGPDAAGCWSGSVIDHDNKLALIYTGGDGHRASICLATSADGISFTRHPANPVIAAPPQGQHYPEFRDPFVWREGETYYLIIGAAIQDVGGAALLYRSNDLIRWQYLKPLWSGNKVDSGTFWEMPVFIKLGEYHVLIVCEVPGRASYWVGRWSNETFTPLSTAPQRLELFNHLLSPTPHTASDGRVITMGIIPDERAPEETWKAGWAHLYSLPRVLHVDAEGRLHQNPLETVSHWSSPLFSESNVALDPSQLRTFPAASGKMLEIKIRFRQGDSASVSLLLRRSPDAQEQTEIRFNWAAGMMTLDRSRSSLNPHVRRDVQTTVYQPETPGTLTLLAYLDVSVLEVFVDARAAFATRLYPTLEQSIGIAAACSGGAAEVEMLTVRSIDLVALRGAADPLLNRD